MDNNDEDEYLYGSEPASKKQKTEEVPEDVPSSKASVEPEKKESEQDEESEYEDDSDDESIEFIINSKPGEKAEAPQQQGPYSNVAPTTMAGTDKVSVALAGKSLDIDQIAEYNGKPITSYSLESFEDKPWRKPGADITDYFNYGFDEVTWSAYCSKQDKLSDFTPQKVMSMLGMGAMEMAMMGAPPMMPGMPAFPGMPGFPPPSQPGMNNNMFGGPPPPGFDGGAYGGSNVQGVAGMIANPHPGGFNGPNNTNNGSGGFNNNGGNRNFQPRNNFQQNSNNNNNNNNWNRNRR